jgi:putative ABC transport system permease protein
VTQYQRRGSRGRSSAGPVAPSLAAAGRYGLVAYGVAQRTREPGLRIALGAVPRDVLPLVMPQGATLAPAGIGVGSPGGR